MNIIDKFLNNLTMYRLVVYVLGALTALGIGFSFAGHFTFSPTNLVVSLLLVLVGAYFTDQMFGSLFNIPTNMESSLITALIIFLILQPATTTAHGVALFLAGVISSASKFLITWNGKHIFNPAAFAAAVMTLTGLESVTWWIGSSVLWPFALVLGLAVVRKIRRFPLFIMFAGVTIVLQYLLFAHAHQPIGLGMKHALLASPLIFLSTIMLTEPATMPPRRNLQLVFGGLVAVLYVTGWSIGSFNISPEIALLLGNVFAFAVSPKLRVRMQLKEIQKVSDNVYNYIFTPHRAFNFIPGQYMEWTLPHVPYDSRGNRRTFTIASSPTEDEVHLGLKYFEPASMYKKALYGMQPGDMIYGSQLAGNFTLKGATGQKLAFVAGGIGITPFRSMVKYLTDNNLQSDVVLLYVVSDANEFAYVKELREAAAVGVKTIPVVTDLAYKAQGVVTAKLRPDMIAQLIPDYADRTFYVSGSSAIVDATQHYLRELGLATTKIKTDHFSGY